jgi:tRNA(fMet)-specific endonuclease VapC
MMYLLDTNTLIYFFKGIGDVAHHLLNQSPKDVSIPAIVLFELEVGIAKSSSPTKRSKQLEELLTSISVLPFGVREADFAARIRARLESKGVSIGPYDILIAGTAIAHHATLITHNIREFGRIDDLVIEDWC